MVEKNDPRLKQIGERLRAIRIEAGYTSGERFAYEHNISRSQYAGYENGADLRMSTLLRILDAHGITPKDFFSEGFE